MNIRRTDNEQFTIDRKVPLWGIVSVVLALAGQAVVMWSGQREQAIRDEHRTEQIQDIVLQVKDLALQLKALSIQIEAKGTKDLEQDFRISEIKSEIGRRLELLELPAKRKP